jgi:hypothetical protein
MEARNLEGDSTLPPVTDSDPTGPQLFCVTCPCNDHFLTWGWRKRVIINFWPPIDIDSLDPCMKGAYLKLLRARQLAELIEYEVTRVTGSESPPKLVYERLDEGRKHQWRIQGLNKLNQLFPLLGGRGSHIYSRNPLLELKGRFCKTEMGEERLGVTQLGGARNTKLNREQG